VENYLSFGLTSIYVHPTSPSSFPPIRLFWVLGLTKAAASNVLDVPEFFWDAEPTLHPLYAAVREYLEIKQRILLLNERCRVFLDLTDILSDSIADSNMSRITWIIIILIVLSIFVTIAEVLIRFWLLNARKAGAGASGVKEL
jgi:hypothetical protein